jgi:hypothetical protein
MMRGIIHTRDLSWESLRSFPGTAELKMLRDESSGGARTI